MWICAYCETENPDESLVCACCAKPKKSPEAVKPAGSAGAAAGVGRAPFESGAFTDIERDLKNVKKSHTATVILLLFLVALLAGALFFLKVNYGHLGYYVSESGVYSLALYRDGSCSWYQDDLRFEGSYEKDGDRLTLILNGRGHYHTTTFTAVFESRALRVNGGTVDDELFTRQKKPEDIRALDEEPIPTPTVDRKG